MKMKENDIMMKYDTDLIWLCELSEMLLSVSWNAKKTLINKL